MNIYIELDHKATVLFVCNRLFLPQIVGSLAVSQWTAGSLVNIIRVPPVQSDYRLLSVTSITRHSFVSILEVFTALA